MQVEVAFHMSLTFFGAFEIVFSLIVNLVRIPRFVAQMASYSSMISLFLFSLWCNALFILIQIWLVAGFGIHVHLGSSRDCVVLLVIGPYRLS